MNQQNEPTFSVEPTGLPNALVVPDSVRYAEMSPGDVGHLRARIAELEAKLKIATGNCEEAVKRAEASHVALVLVRERLVEPLEAKLAIATANCEQAVRERDLARARLADLQLYTLHGVDRERLAAAEAVCQLVDERLTPSFDLKMDDLIARWTKLKETKEPKP